MGAYNKTTAAILAGAAVTLIAVALPAEWKTVEVLGAAQTIVTAAIVYFVPNKPAR